MKQFDTRAVLGAASGFNLGCGFGPIHEVCEYTLGHPIWTHEFAEHAIWVDLGERILLQHPDLAPFAQRLVKGCDWQTIEAECIAAVGAELMIIEGQAQRTEHPVDSFKRIAPDKPLVVIVGPAE